MKFLVDIVPILARKDIAGIKIATVMSETKGFDIENRKRATTTSVLLKYLEN